MPQREGLPGADFRCGRKAGLWQRPFPRPTVSSLGTQKRAGGLSSYSESSKETAASTGSQAGSNSASKVECGRTGGAEPSREESRQDCSVDSDWSFTEDRPWLGGIHPDQVCLVLHSVSWYLNPKSTSSRCDTRPCGPGPTCVSQGKATSGAASGSGGRPRQDPH